MPDRSWFFAANGQQQGPYPEPQFRDLVARGAITRETLVWTEGMAGWEKAGNIPGLISAAAPLAAPRLGDLTTGADGSGSSLSLVIGIWDFIWRGFLLVLSLILVIPAPWVIVWFMKWFTSCVHVPGRPNLTFTGRALTVLPWYYAAVVLGITFLVIAYVRDNPAIKEVNSLIQILLSWLFIKWLIGNLASNGQPLGLSFSGSFWGYLGWTLLAGLAIITIIGWAWVYTALARWICRNIQGTRRQVVFKGTGLQYLWRALVTVFACLFIIPLPWVARWLLQWQASQTELVSRSGYTDA